MLSVTRTSSDPRRGRAKRVIAILALAAAAGAARAQLQVPPPLRTAAVLADIAADEARLLPCTVADVAGEFARLAQTGTLQMAALPCEPWVTMAVGDGFGGSEPLASRAGAGAPTLAFALAPEEAQALRSAGVASGAAVPLNDVVTAVAVGPRTPGFGGSLGRVSRRASAALLGGAGGAGGVGGAGGTDFTGGNGGNAGLLDGGRPFPAEAVYEPLSVSPTAPRPTSPPSAGAPVGNLSPNGAIVILTAAEPGAAPVPGARGPVSAGPVAVDAGGGAGGAAGLLVSGSGGLSPLGAELRNVWAPVGGDPSMPPAVVGSVAAVRALEPYQKSIRSWGADEKGSERGG